MYFTTADGGDRYLQDKDFLKTCFIFACLSQRNHCLSFNGSDGRLYRNELCLDVGTIAKSKLNEFKLTKDEQDLLGAFDYVLTKAKTTKTIIRNIRTVRTRLMKSLTRVIKMKMMSGFYDYPELNTAINSLKTKLARYYETTIQPKLFEYELLK